MRVASLLGVSRQSGGLEKATIRAIDLEEWATRHALCTLVGAMRQLEGYDQPKQPRPVRRPPKPPPLHELEDGPESHVKVRLRD
jgi:hypothetical protein